MVDGDDFAPFLVTEEEARKSLEDGECVAQHI